MQISRTNKLKTRLHINNILNNTENKQSFNLPDLGLSSALGLLAPEPNSNDEQQIPVKRKKKKSKQGFKW